MSLDKQPGLEKDLVVFILQLDSAYYFLPFIMYSCRGQEPLQSL